MKVIDHPATVQSNDAVVLSVIAPCFNEHDNIDALADRTLSVFDEMGIGAELVLVDDGSSDGTWDCIVRRSAHDERVRGVRRPINGGIECAWRAGLAAAGGQLVCLIDGDLQNRPEDVPRLYKAYLRELPDIVQGVRHPVAGARQRRFFSRVLNFLLNRVFRMHLQDSKSGFLLSRRQVLLNLLKHRFHYRYFQSFIGVAAGLARCAIVEVDTSFDRRNAGRSFLGRFPILVSLRICWELMKFRVENWLPDRRRASGMGEWTVSPVLAETAAGDM